MDITIDISIDELKSMYRLIDEIQQLKNKYPLFVFSIQIHGTANLLNE